MAECNVDQYLRQRERNPETQEPELEAERHSQVEGDHLSPNLLLPLPRTPQYEPLVPQYEEPHCFQDRNFPELVNDLESEKETNDPLYWVESYRNLPKEYRSRTQGSPPHPLHLPPPPSPRPSLPPLQAHGVDLVTTDDLGNDKSTSPTKKPT